MVLTYYQTTYPTDNVNDKQNRVDVLVIEWVGDMAFCGVRTTFTDGYYYD